MAKRGKRGKKGAGKGKMPALSKKFLDGNTVNVQGQNTSTAKSGGGVTTFGVSKLVTPGVASGIVRRTGTGRNSSKPANLCGSLQLGTVSTGASGAAVGDLLTKQEMRLDMFTDSRAAIMAKLYSRWRIKKWVVSYAPACATSEPGSMVLFIDPDPESEYHSPNPQNAKVGCERKMNVQGNVWAPMVLPYDAIPRDRDVLFTNSLGADERLDTAGLFLIAALTPIAANKTLGTLMLDYEIEFSEENTQINSLTVVSAACVVGGGTFNNSTSPLGTTQTQFYNTIGIQPGPTFWKLPGLSSGDRFSLLTKLAGSSSPTLTRTLRNLTDLGSAVIASSTEEWRLSTMEVTDDGTGLAPRISCAGSGTITGVEAFFWVVPAAPALRGKALMREYRRLAARVERLEGGGRTPGGPVVGTPELRRVMEHVPEPYPTSSNDASQHDRCPCCGT
jgi:hypothetical protein